MYEFDQTENSIRRKELRMSQFFKFMFGLKLLYQFTLTSIEISCTNLNTTPPVYAMVPLIMSCVNLAFKTLVFMVLIVLMFRHGWHEFNKIKKPLCIYFIVDFLSYSLTILIFTDERYGFKGNVVQEFVIAVFYVLNVPQMLAAVAVLYFKDKSDMLQQLSKLDYLVKVSIFQQYKTQKGKVTLQQYYEQTSRR